MATSWAMVNHEIHARAIFAAALARVDPLTMMARSLACEGPTLHLSTENQTGCPGLAQTPRGEARGGTQRDPRKRAVPSRPCQGLTLDLETFDRILVFGAGKASARMALGLEQVLGKWLTGGVVAVKAGHTESLDRIQLLEAAHPVPDATSVTAAHALLALGQQATERTLFLGLTSGGGSALLCAPAPGLTLADKQETTRLLLACGADIQSVNTVRRHLSAIKGGRLAAALAPGRVVNLILSDVLGDTISAIASGITALDGTRLEDARAVLARYDLLARVPSSVRRHLENPAPEARPPVRLDRTDNLILGSNALALDAARICAEGLGWRTEVLAAPLCGEARHAARQLLEHARDMPPGCLLGGGETTVTVRGPGRGGRNQELALAALVLGQEHPALLEDITLLSAGTDGNDGPTDAAGAFAAPALLQRAQAMGIDPGQHLARNDSYAFFSQVGGHLKTGPTNTNVCDLQVLLKGFQASNPSQDGCMSQTGCDTLPTFLRP